MTTTQTTWTGPMIRINQPTFTVTRRGIVKTYTISARDWDKACVWVNGELIPSGMCYYYIADMLNLGIAKLA